MCLQYLGIAYKAATILRFDQEQSTIEPGNLYEKHPVWFRKEIIRRCFWAVWFTQCINFDHCMTDTLSSNRISSLPLPMSGTAFYEVREEPLISLKTRESSSADAISTTSVFREHMFLVLHWSVSEVAYICRSSIRIYDH